MTKTHLRVTCEQAVLEIVEQARASLWTLRQLRDALRARRREVMAPWKGPRRRAVGRAWYAAARAVCGVPVTKLRHPKQIPLPLEERP